MGPICAGTRFQLRFHLAILMLNTRPLPRRDCSRRQMTQLYEGDKPVAFVLSKISSAGI